MRQLEGLVQSASPAHRSAAGSGRSYRRTGSGTCHRCSITMSLLSFPCPFSLIGAGKTSFCPFQLMTPAAVAFCSGHLAAGPCGLTAGIRAIGLRWEVPSTTSPARTRARHSKRWLLCSRTDTTAGDHEAIRTRQLCHHGCSLPLPPAGGRRPRRWGWLRPACRLMTRWASGQPSPCVEAAGGGQTAVAEQRAMGWSDLHRPQPIPTASRCGKSPIRLPVGSVTAGRT